jgi:hypothetical protein
LLLKLRRFEVEFGDRRGWVRGVSFAAAAGDAAGVRRGVGLRWVWIVVVVSFARLEGMLRGVGRGGGGLECSVVVLVGAAAVVVVVVAVAFELA